MLTAKEQKLEISILYVEDEPIIQQGIAEMLARKTHNLFLAQNGKQGLEMFIEKKPDIVITDVNMPIMDGLTMSAKIKTLNSKTQIILLTAHSDANFFIDAIEIGINQYILKPVETNKLVSALNQCVEIVKAEQRQQNYYAELEKRVAERTQELNKANQELNLEIDERKKIEADLIKAKNAAEYANKAKSEFLANMSHEIRTPLNAIIGFTRLLKEEKISNKALEYTQTILTNSNILFVLINDILDLSKIEAGKLEITNHLVNLKHILNDLVQMFSIKIQEKKLQFLIEIDANMPETMFLDEIRIRQILMNLTGNAFKFTENGYVKIKVYYQNQDNNLISLVFDVEDSGIGIPKDQQEIIFESFKQQSGQSYRKYGGTGLGLTITKRLVEAIGGTISLTSEVSKGSIFKVSIPNVKYSNEIIHSEEDISQNKDNEIHLEEATTKFSFLNPQVIEDLKNTDKVFINDALLDLETKLYEVYCKIRKTNHIQSIKVFAQEIIEIGTHFQIAILIEYGKELNHQTECFNIKKMHQILFKYADILDILKARLEN